jgi:hypothetical protein
LSSTRDGTSWENGGTKAKKKKMGGGGGGGTGMKKRKKIQPNFFFFGNWGGGPWPPPVPPKSVSVLNIINGKKTQVHNYQILRKYEIKFWTPNKGMFGIAFKRFKSTFNTQKARLKKKKKSSRLVKK